jgi:hypothetical protein
LARPACQYLHRAQAEDIGLYSSNPRQISILCFSEGSNELTAQYFGVVLDSQKRGYLARIDSEGEAKKAADLIFKF